MKPITKRNVKAKVPLPVKGNPKTEYAVKHHPDLAPKNRRIKE
jgi:hypothetical protein